MDAQTRMRLDGWCVIEDVIPTDRVEAVRQATLTTTEKHRNPVRLPISVTSPA